MIAHSVSRRTRLLLSKSKVYIHPSPSTGDKTPGYIVPSNKSSTPQAPSKCGDEEKHHLMQLNLSLSNLVAT